MFKITIKIISFFISKFYSFKIPIKSIASGLFQFFESDFPFTPSFILKRREKLPKSANNTSTSDVAQALILDHFGSIRLVFWSIDYLFYKRSENHRLSADNILIIDLKRSLVVFRFSVKKV